MRCGGEEWHRRLQELLGPDLQCERETIWNNIVAHPDAIYKDGAIVELITGSMSVT